MILFAKQKCRHRRGEQMYGHQGGEGEWDDLGGCDDMYILLCVK